MGRPAWHQPQAPRGTVGRPLNEQVHPKGLGGAQSVQRAPCQQVGKLSRDTASIIIPSEAGWAEKPYTFMLPPGPHSEHGGSVP